MSRGIVISQKVKLVTEECIECGVVFAFPSQLQDVLIQRKGTTFYCPNGHGQVYAGKTDAEKLREAEERNLSLRQRLDQAEADAAAKKKEIARMKRRAKAGLCQFCRRHFVNVERHVERKHPEKSACTGKATL